MSAEPFRVLALHSYHQGLSWTDAVQRGLGQAFEESSVRAEFAVEYMDAKRHPGHLVFAALAKLHAAKYERWRPDLIVSSDDDALAFLFEYRERIFPGVPVVFCGLDAEDHDPSMFEGRDGYTGVVERLDLASTVDLILHLQPKAERVAFIHDRTISGLAARRIVEDMSSRYSDRLEFVFPDEGSGLGADELISYLEKIDRETVVYFLGFFRDRFETPLSMDSFVPRVSKASPVPVYSHAEPFMGLGIIGGKLLSGEVHGRSAGKKALRVLRGEPVEALPVSVESSNRHMFDYRQLKRFSITESRLPEGSVVLFEPSSFFERHRAVFAWGIAGAALLCVFIFLLVEKNIRDVRFAKQLAESEKKYRSLFDSLADGVAESDLDGKIIQCNQAYLDMTGHSFEEIKAFRYQDLTPKRWRETDEKHMAQALERGYSDPYEKERLKKDGGIIPISIRIWSKNDENGNPVGSWGITRDITERKRSEEALMESERRFKAVYEGIPLLLALWDREVDDFVLADVNPATVEISKSTIHERLGEPLSEFYKDAPHIIDAIERCHSQQIVVRMETVYNMRTTSEDKLLSLSFVPISPDTVMAVAQDITERKRAEEVLALNEERLNAALKLHVNKDLDEKQLCKLAIDEAVRLTNSRVGFLRLLDNKDGDSASTFYSQEALELCFAGKKKDHLILEKSGIPDDSSRLKKTAIFNACGNGKHKKVLPEGHVPIDKYMAVPVLENEEVVAAMVVGNKHASYDDADIRQMKLFSASVWEILREKKLLREKQELEQKLNRERRMESLGALAGGIAHEFNNVLGIVIGNTELAMEDLEEIDKAKPLKKYLDEILQASLRATGVVKQILRFLQKMPSEKSPVNIMTVVRESVKLMRATIPKSILIRRAFFCEFEKVMANPTEISQLLINVIMNSVHAMTGEGGTIEVRLEPAFLDYEEAVRYEGLSPGNYARLTVNDDGSGIEPEILDRIFEPYFTTKNFDEGLGMGLAVAYGIVKNCDGAIKAESSPGEGTRIEVLIPLLDTESPIVEKDSAPPPKDSERILFIDDEASLVKTAIAMLKRLNYRVVGKTNALEALELFQADPGGYDLVITDMAMPGMPGDRLIGKLKKIRHDIPVMLCTGHSDFLDEDKTRELGIKTFVTKPLLKLELAGAVGKALAEK